MSMGGFKPGNTYGRHNNHKGGRMSRFDEEELDRVMNRGWPRKDRVQVVRTLHARAMAGDVAAAALLLAYSYGKPRQQLEHHVDQNQVALIPMTISSLTGFAPLPDGAIDISPEETGADVQVEEVKPVLTNGNGHAKCFGAKSTQSNRAPDDDDDTDRGDGDDWAL